MFADTNKRIDRGVSGRGKERTRGTMMIMTMERNVFENHDEVDCLSFFPLVHYRSTVFVTISYKLKHCAGNTKSGWAEEWQRFASFSLVHYLK